LLTSRQRREEEVSNEAAEEATVDQLHRLLVEVKDYLEDADTRKGQKLLGKVELVLDSWDDDAFFAEGTAADEDDDLEDDLEDDDDDDEDDLEDDDEDDLDDEDDYDDLDDEGSVLDEALDDEEDEPLEDEPDEDDGDDD
jgi:hypothetical protein